MYMFRHRGERIQPGMAASMRECNVLLAAALRSLPIDHRSDTRHPLVISTMGRNIRLIYRVPLPRFRSLVRLTDVAVA